MGFGVRRLMYGKYSKYVISAVLGLGLATLFRKVCNNRSCLVFFGPKYNNFHEAEELIKKGGGFSIANGEEFYMQISSLLNEEDVFLRSSYSATNVVHNNLGSSTRIVRSLIHD